jgi:hypothetical protein
MKKLVAIALLAMASPAIAADPSQPHPHQGILAPISGPPGKPTLTEDDLAKLASGEAVLKQIREDDGGRGIAVQDVRASPEHVWSKITSYSRYPDWVDGVYECDVYETTADHIKARFLIGASLIKVEYFVDHTYKPDQGWMTWTLDYSRQSDLDDSVGYWRVEALPDKPGWTRVYYSVRVKLSGWVPGWVESMIADRGLTQATEWVKRESEKG